MNTFTHSNSLLNNHGRCKNLRAVIDHKLMLHMKTCYFNVWQLCILMFDSCVYSYVKVHDFYVVHLNEYNWQVLLLNCRTKTRARRKRRNRMLCESWGFRSSASTFVWESLVTDWHEHQKCWNSWLASSLSSLKVSY